jgi:hypothetical protein
MSEHLQCALVSHALIDQALGIIMGQKRCTANQAFEALRTISRNRNVKLRDIAVDMITAVSGQRPIESTGRSPDPLARARPTAGPAARCGSADEWPWTTTLVRRRRRGSASDHAARSRPHVVADRGTGIAVPPASPRRRGCAPIAPVAVPA